MEVQPGDEVRKARRIPAHRFHAVSARRLTVRKTSAMAGFLALAICANATVGAAQPTGAPNETPTRQGKLTKPPKLTQFVEAVYPESEKLAGRTASVILQIAISDKG